MFGGDEESYLSKGLLPSIENLLHLECRTLNSCFVQQTRMSVGSQPEGGGSEGRETSSLPILDKQSIFKHKLAPHSVRKVAKPICKHPKSPGEILFLFKLSTRLWGLFSQFKSIRFPNSPCAGRAAPPGNWRRGNIILPRPKTTP